VKGGLITFIEYEAGAKIQRLNGENPKEAPSEKYKYYSSSNHPMTYFTP
jgi:hypothetical protein